MAEKAGVAQHYLIICELCELCEQMPSVNFIRKVSMFSGKLRTRKSAKYMPPGSLIEAIANATVERGSQCGEQDGDSISCQRTIRESQQTAAISLQASSDEAASGASVTNSAVTCWHLCQNVTNVTHLRVRVSTLCGRSEKFFLQMLAYITKNQ